jgi:hypothetical protein
VSSETESDSNDFVTKIANSGVIRLAADPPKISIYLPPDTAARAFVDAVERFRVLADSQTDDPKSLSVALQDVG